MDLSENGKLALAGIEVTPASTMFLNDLITSYVAKLRENIAARFPSLPLVQSFAILQVLPVKEARDFKTYGMNHIVATLSDHFGATGCVEVAALESERKHFKFMAQDLK